MLRRRPQRAQPLAPVIEPVADRVVIAACADSDPPVQESIFAAIGDEDPDLVLFAGDASYVGASDRLRRESLRLWREDWGHLADRVYAVPGNHDFDSSRALEIWRASMPATEGAPPGHEGLVFSVMAGPVRAVGMTPIDGVVPDEQLAWAERELRAGDCPHRIAVFHEPAWPCGRRIGGSLDALPGERDHFWALLEDAGVGLVVNGHEHGYSRRAVTLRRRIVQFIVAGAGGVLYAEHEGLADVFVPSFNYLLVTADAQTMDCRAIALDGRLLDAVTIPAAAPRPEADAPP